MSLLTQIRQTALFTLVTFLVLAGCSPTDYSRYSSKGETFIPRNEKIGLIITDVNVFEVSAGGVNVKKVSETESARKYLIEEFTKKLESKKYAVKYIEVDTITTNSTNEMLATYNVISNSLLKSSGKVGSRGKVIKDEVGPVDTLLQALGVDALFVVRAADEVPSASRNATKALGMVTGALFGVSYQTYEWTTVSIGFINSQGKIDYFNVLNEANTFDLHNAKHADEVCKAILKKFPAR